jgi:hypothetical protein
MASKWQICAAKNHWHLIQVISQGMVIYHGKSISVGETKRIKTIDNFSMHILH